MRRFLPAQSVALCALLLAMLASGDGPRAEERPGRTLLQAAETDSGWDDATPVGGDIGPDGSAEPGGGSFWKSLISDHWLHVALIFGASEVADGLDAAGPRSSPLIFGSPPAFDRSIRDSFATESDGVEGGEWLETQATPVTRGLAAAIIFSSNGSRWRDDVTDLVGLWEAQRFNTAATAIVKNLVGRERPRLESAQESSDTSATGLFLESDPSYHQSFYSFHASSTFTTISYADLVLSRRLAGHPAARRWARAGLYSLGAAIAWQRIRQDGHYLSDVAVGALAGIVTGRSFYAFNHRDGEDRWLSWDPRGRRAEGATAGSARRRRFTLAPPVVVPGGFFLSARVEF